MNTEETLQPHRPQQMSEHAEACLLALSARGLGRKISLGGAFGLAHWIRDLRFEDVLMD
jgi:hypothetical protein